MKLKEATASASADLSCLDHSYFMADVTYLLEQAMEHRRHLSLRDTREAAMSPYARRPCDSVGMQVLAARLREIEVSSRSGHGRPRNDRLIWLRISSALC
eukprot:COSAG02_NODE_7130_length_3166_cov_9.166309_2_plen_100_part_00